MSRAVASDPRAVRPGASQWAHQAALFTARAREDPSRTRQSLLTLATFRSWGIRWMTPHEGPSERLPDPAPGCEPAPTGPHRPPPELVDAPQGSRTVPAGASPRPAVRPRGADAARPAPRDRSHRPGLAPGMGGPIYSFLVARGRRRVEHLEDSPSGLWRTLGKRVGCKPSGVRIPHPPPPPRNLRDSGVLSWREENPQTLDGAELRSTSPRSGARGTPASARRSRAGTLRRRRG